MSRRDGRVNAEWLTNEMPNFTWEQVNTEVLMDIRAELRTLNALLRCPNFTSIPWTLKDISKNTKNPRRKRKERAK